MAFIALALPAAAQDCLTGAFTLPDQRGLASLRTDTEAACPCASFVRRSEYQTCARDVLKAAIAAGDVRPECKRVAKAINRGAVCGSTKVACGRYKPAADMPLSCRVKDPADCEDGPAFESTPCPNETHCADVVDWTASTCVDVREDGPFGRGARVITFVKQSVTKYCAGGTGDCTTLPYGPDCRCSADDDCQSASCTTRDRALQTTIWYPAPPGSGPIAAAYAAVLDAPLDLTGGPYPLLMFSHGSCGYPNQSLFLTALLASHGFVVVAPPHPGNTLSDFPGCGSSQALVTSFAERPQDILYVLDQMLAADLDSGSPFFGAIDETRLGMSGHSFGGLTTYLTIPLEPRFKIALPMAPAVPGSPVLDVPSLTMLGQIDSVVNNPAIRTAYADALSPKYLVEIANAGHFAFSDACFPSPDCAPPATLTQAEAHDAVRRYALPFLKVYLTGDPTFVPFLTPPAGPGFVLQVEP
jgi:dienelactone hydrolase